MALPVSLLWIDGSHRASSTGRTYNVLNSGSQAVVGYAACASSEDALAAIEAAAAAQPAWEAVHPATKRDILLKASDLIQTPKYADRVMDIMQTDTAAHETWAAGEVPATVALIRDAALCAVQLLGETMPSERADGGTVLVERRALGTVFAISPFNSPVLLAARAVVVPIACGNTVVLKSSEVSPRCAEIVVEALYEAGLPKNVVNLLHISREDAPKIVAEIIAHKKIRHINFTGSDRVGRIIAAEAAKYLKPCVFELGGKSPVVVLDDANVEEAARSIIFGAMFHSGQICMSTERVLIQRGISKALITVLKDLTQKIQASTQPDASISPLFCTAAAEKVISLISDAKARGGNVLVGDITHTGAVVQPHIVLGIEPGWPLWEQESFGPVFGIKIADTEAELVQLANQTDYSLTAAVWTTDMGRGLRVARGIRAGQVNINEPTFAPESRLGVHGLGGATGYGRFDIENFTQRHIIVLSSTKLKLPLVDSL